MLALNHKLKLYGPGFLRYDLWLVVGIRSACVVKTGTGYGDGPDGCVGMTEKRRKRGD